MTCTDSGTTVLQQIVVKYADECFQIALVLYY